MSQAENDVPRWLCVCGAMHDGPPRTVGEGFLMHEPSESNPAREVLVPDHSWLMTGQEGKRCEWKCTTHDPACRKTTYDGRG